MLGVSDELEDALEFAELYQSLGWAVQNQLKQLLEGDIGGQNPNAISLIKSRLGGRFSEIDEALEDWERSEGYSSDSID